MELKKGIIEESILWRMSGIFDDDSTLGFEETILNSDYHGEDLIFDMTDVDEVSENGLRSLGRVVKEARSEGAIVRLLPPGGRRMSSFQNWVLEE